MSTTGLSVNNVVDVTVTLQATGSSTRNFGALLLLGTTAGVFSDTENLRAYTGLDDVGEDFGTTDPEYIAADLFFSQSPQPSTLYIGEVRDGEDIPTAVSRLEDYSADWYGLALATTSSIAASTITDVAEMVEGFSVSRSFWFTSQDAAAYDASSTTDLPYLLSKAGYTRTIVQYSSSSPYAAVSMFGRIATVDYSADNTTLTLKFKTEPDITAETLTQTQANALDAKDCNYYVNYQNGDAIIQQGVTASGEWIDTLIGLDAFQNALQVAGWNALYTSTTKIPQTDSGMNILLGVYETVCAQFVDNGLFAPGTWTGPNIGSLLEGGTLTKGYYAYMEPVADQSSSDRAARQAVPCQIACKLAGAVHSSSVAVTVVN
ncbi:DUF3383 family protein [Komagataeibacter intermedius]|uniref:DUF3383 family protein n=1 Tax=Komagataeibacter intermedius TaxID=66229 RepID=UPI003B437AC3